MTTRANEWLPVEALVDPRLKARLDEAVLRWGERWLGAAGMFEIAGFGHRKPITKLPTTPIDWRATETGISCVWTEQLALKFGLVIVDSKDRNRLRSKSDKTLLAGLAWEALLDLTDLFAKSLRLETGSHQFSADYERQIGWRVNSITKLLPELEFKVPASALVPARKALIGSNTAVYAAEDRLSDLCANTSLPIQAVLGAANMSWSECRDLEAGDVVILDQLLEMPFPLTALKSGSEVCKVSLSQDESRLRLAVVEPEA